MHTRKYLFVLAAFLFWGGVLLQGQQSCEQLRAEAEAAFRQASPDYKEAITKYRVAYRFCSEDEIRSSINTRIAEIQDAQVKALEEALLDAEQQKENAQRQFERAEREGKLAEARRLALKSSVILQDSAREALFLAWTALNMLDTPSLRVQQAFGEAVVSNLGNGFGKRYQLAKDKEIGQFVACGEGFVLRPTDSDMLYLAMGELTQARRLPQSVSNPTISVHPDGTHFLVYGEENGGLLYDLYQDEPTPLAGHSETITHASFSPLNYRLLTTSRDNKARIWDYQDDQYAELDQHTGNVYEGHFTAAPGEGKEMAITRSSDGTVRTWDGETGAPRKLIDQHEIYVYDLTLSDQQDRILTASADQTVRLWRLDGSLVRTFPHDAPVREAQFSPDGKYILSKTTTQNWYIWKTGDPQDPLLLKGHDLPIQSVAFHPNEPLLISWAEDEKALLWNLEKGKRSELSLNHREVSWASFSPDGNYLLTSSGKGNAKQTRLWDLAGRTLLLLNHRTSAAIPARFGDSGGALQFANDNELLVMPLPQRAMVEIEKEGFFSPDEKQEWINRFGIRFLEQRYE